MRYIPIFLILTVGTSNWMLGAATEGPEQEGAAVLNAHFSTVAYTTTNLLVSFDQRERQVGKWQTLYDYPLALRLPYVPLVGGLRALGPESLTALAPEYTAFLAGARDFTPPSGIGLSSFNSCYVGVSISGEHASLLRVFRGAEPKSLSGRSYWAWTAVRPPEVHFYATAVGPHFLVICGDLNDAQLVAADLAMTVERSIPHVRADLGLSNYWISQGNLLADGAATGTRMALEGDYERRVGHLRVYLSQGKSDTAKPASLPLAGQLSYKEAAGGFWEGEVRMDQSPEAVNVLYKILALFGFVLNL